MSTNNLSPYDQQQTATDTTPTNTSGLSLPSDIITQELQARITAILNEGKSSDGEYNLVSIMMVFDALGQAYTEMMGLTSSLTNQVSTMTQNAADMQDQINNGQNITAEQAQQFIQDMYNQATQIYQLQQSGQITASTASTLNAALNDLANNFFDSSSIVGDGTDTNAANNIYAGINFTGVSANPTMDTTTNLPEAVGSGVQTVGSSDEVAGNIAAFFAAQQPDGSVSPSAAAQTAATNVNQDFVNIKQGWSSASTAAQSLNTFESNQLQQVQSAEYNFGAFVTGWNQSEVQNQKVQ